MYIVHKHCEQNHKNKQCFDNQRNIQIHHSSWSSPIFVPNSIQPQCHWNIGGVLLLSFGRVCILSFKRVYIAFRGACTFSFGGVCTLFFGGVCRLSFKECAHCLQSSVHILLPSITMDRRYHVTILKGKQKLKVEHLGVQMLV